MPLPKTCLVETIASSFDPGAGAMRKADVLDPMAAGRLIAVSASTGTYVASVAFPGRYGITSFTDEVNEEVSYPAVGSSASSMFDLTFNGIPALESKETAVDGTDRRGYRLPVAAIQGKSALTLAAIVRYSAAFNGVDSEALVGSAVNGNTTQLLHFGRASASGKLQIAARRNSTADTSYNVTLDTLPPTDQFIALLARIHYQDGWMALDALYGDPALDQLSGRKPAFTGSTGVSGTIANQGLVLGGRGGATNASTWDAYKFRGDFRGLGMWSVVPSETRYTQNIFSPLTYQREKLRARIRQMNAA